MASELRFHGPPAKQVPVKAFVIRRLCRSGFSLLELMLALALLGGLLAVAWSLLGTFRNAETRGWKLAHHTQTIRAARRWLQQDLDVAIGGSQPPTIFGPPRQPQLQLKGDALGFSVVVLPGIDSLPFLEAMLNATDEESEARSSASDSPLATADRSLSASGVDAAAEMGGVTRSPWPHTLLRIEYELRPLARGAERASDESTGAGIGPPVDGSAEPQYELVRKEIYDPNLLGTPLTNENFASENGSDSGGSSLRPSDRELTAADLYRQNDDEDYAAGGTLLREARLHGLVAPQFRYSDGQQWMSEWNSRVQGGLPRAVAFSFNFPARSEIQRPEPSRAMPAPYSGDSVTDQELREEEFVAEAAQASFAETVLDSQPLAEIEVMDGASQVFPTSNQVQVIVRLQDPYHVPSSTRPATGSAEESSSTDGVQDRGFSSQGDYR